MRNLIFLIYGINISYSLSLIIIPWRYITNIIVNAKIFIPLINVIFNVILTFILFIPNVKRASLRHYTYTGMSTRKRIYYIIAIVGYVFELLLTLIILGVGIQLLSIYHFIFDDIAPLISTVCVLLLFIIYNTYTIKTIDINNNSYNYISLVLLICIIGLSIYLMIILNFQFNIINFIFIGNITSMTIFEFIGYISFIN